MKRVIPDEIRKMQGWLLSGGRFASANIISDVIHYMENGMPLPENHATAFKEFLIEYNKSHPPKGKNKEDQMMEHFTTRYGLKNAQFILSRLRTAIDTYSLEDLVSMGNKIALFNGWAKIQDL